MKKIISLVVVVAIIVTGIIFVPKIAHTCDDCEKFFLGAGYESNMSRTCFLARSRLSVRSVQKSSMHFLLLWENLLMILSAIYSNKRFI